MSSSTVYKIRGAQILRNINYFIGGHKREWAQFVSDKKGIFAKWRWKNAVSQNSNSGKEITTFRNEF